MLTTLACVTALTLALGQTDALNLTAARLTNGILGPERPDNKLLPGDSLYLAFEIEGITTDDGGKVHYGTSTEVLDAAGKVQFRQPSQELTVVNALGGKSLPAFARVDIGLDQPPGNYTLKVTVTDRGTKQSKSLTQEFTVLPKAFGLVGLTFTSDADAQIPAGLLGVGQSVFINAALVGFGRDAAGKGDPHIAMEMRILDEAGKPTLPKPFQGTVRQNINPRAASVPVQFLLALNRPGKFTVEVKATCQVSGKTVNRSFPIHVVSAK